MIVAGFGFTSRATEASLRDAYARCAKSADTCASLAEKAEHVAFQAFATRAGLPVRLVSQAALSAQTTITHSPKSMHVKGTGSVAEACALAAAGDGARLLGPRVISEDRQATCALAEGGQP